MRARHARLHRGPYVAVQLALLVLVLSSVVAVAVASAAAAPQQTDADASVAGVASSTGEEGMGAEDGASPLPDFAAMRVKQLRAVLAERGVRCVGCVEKAHFVERARETWHLPVKTATQPPTGARAEPSPLPDDLDMSAILAKMKKEEEAKQNLMETLRKQGFDTSRMNMGGFDANSFGDAMRQANQNKRGRQQRRRSKSKKKGGKKRKRRQEQREEDEPVDEHIEL